MIQHATRLMYPFKCIIMNDFKVLSLISVVSEAYFLYTQFGAKEKNQPQRQVVSGLMCPLLYLSIITPRVHNTSQYLVI